MDATDDLRELTLLDLREETEARLAVCLGAKLLRDPLFLFRGVRLIPPRAGVTAVTAPAGRSRDCTLF